MAWTFLNFLAHCVSGRLESTNSTDQPSGKVSSPRKIRSNNKRPRSESNYLGQNPKKSRKEYNLEPELELESFGSTRRSSSSSRMTMEDSNSKLDDTISNDISINPISLKNESELDNINMVANFEEAKPLRAEINQSMWNMESSRGK